VKIALGVVEIPYTEGGKSTGDIAEILEGKFDVMGIFAEKHSENIADMVAQGFADSIDNIFAGAPENFDIYAGAMAKIENQFIEYIDSEEHAIPTKAKAIGAAGARKKRQYRKTGNKITFVDSGMYRNSFRAWVKEE
jgi:hypothetical protein